MPNGASDTATFGDSVITDVSLSAATTVDGIVFSPGASAYTISLSQPDGNQLSIVGAGISNSSGAGQNFLIPADPAFSGGSIYFSNNAVAGISTTFTNNGGGTNFLDSSSADQAAFVTSGGGGFYGVLEFFGTSTADRATFINNVPLLSLATARSRAGPFS